VVTTRGYDPLVTTRIHGQKTLIFNLECNLFYIILKRVASIDRERYGRPGCGASFAPS
jgi:hypothetical protein